MVQIGLICSGVNSASHSFNISLNEAGLYRVVVSNSAGNINNPDCNEVSDPVEIIVFPNSPDTQLIEEICQGESFIVGSDTYTTSGNYSNLLTNINGCDSIVNLALTVNPIYTINIVETICQGESITVGTSIYTSSGNYTDLLTSINGCDSVVNCVLTVNPMYTINIVRHADATNGKSALNLPRAEILTKSHNFEIDPFAM